MDLKRAWGPLVVFFRDQNLSVDEHIAFGRRFGDLHVHPARGDYREAGNLPPEILIIHADENTKRTAGEKWHSDVCRFRWQPNSIAMWDNRCTLHHAMWDYFPQVRSGRRVTVSGDKPF